MTNEEIKKKVRQQIANKLSCRAEYCQSSVNCNGTCSFKLEKADQILSLSGDDWELAIVKKNTEYPNYWTTTKLYSEGTNTMRHVFTEEQKEALKKAGFRQEVK